MSVRIRSSWNHHHESCYVIRWVAESDGSRSLSLDRRGLFDITTDVSRNADLTTIGPASDLRGRITCSMRTRSTVSYRRSGTVSIRETRAYSPTVRNCSGRKRRLITRSSLADPRSCIHMGSSGTRHLPRRMPELQYRVRGRSIYEDSPLCWISAAGNHHPDGRSLILS